jgi:hypothetical protein
MRSFEVWAAARLPSHALPATLLAGGPVDYYQKCLWSSHTSGDALTNMLYILCLSFSDVKLALSLGNPCYCFSGRLDTVLVLTVGHTTANSTEVALWQLQKKIF